MRRDGAALKAMLWSLPTAAAIVYVSWLRVSGLAPPIPFLILLASVIVAGLGGGRWPGLIGGLTAAAFVVHSSFVGFGPETLTGGLLQVVAGCLLYAGVGWFVGVTRDRNRVLIERLSRLRGNLEDTVRARTSELEQVNAELRGEIEERAAAEAAVEASKVKVRHVQRLESLGVFAGGIAHDFNNLLTVIMGQTELARLAATEDVRALMLAEVEEAAKRAAALCHRILTYAGKEEVAISSVDVKALLDETLSLVRASVSKKVTFEVAATGDTTVAADRAQLGQLLMNLLTNAAEAIEDVGVVRLTLADREVDAATLGTYWLGEQLEPGRCLALEVEDNGCGMSDEQLARVFEPFFSTKFTGRGLGLAVVFGIIRAHGGAIRVNSEEGVGTRFAVLLPHRTAPAPAPRRPAPPSRAARPVQRGSILIADDEPAVRGVARLILERAGWTVREAANGVEAVTSVRDGEPLSLVILDMTMPAMDGCRALQEIRSLDQNVPVIVMSGYQEEVAQTLGHTAFLAKPFTADDLTALTEACARPSSTRESPSSTRES